MIRRTFFQTLAAALLPQPVIAAAKTMQPGCEPPARAPHSPAPIQDPESLQEWREIPKMEVFAKDLPGHEDPTESPPPSQTPIYLLGWCQTRQAARNFRLDQMEMVETSAWFSKTTGKPG